MNDISRAAQDTARKLGDNDVVEVGARIGYVASGILHLLLAWIAVSVAWSDRRAGQRPADQSGAFGTLASHGWGMVLLVVMVAGMALLGIWQLTEAVRRRRTGQRVKSAAKAVTYFVLAGTAATFLLSNGTSSGKQTQSTTQTALSWPGGPWLVGLAGLVVLGVGGYHVYKGVAQKFREDLVQDPGDVAVWAARVGYALKGVAFGVIGVLLVTAAVHHDARGSRGLDGAVKTLLQQPFGVAVVTLVALGFAAYGVYSFFRARFARV